MFHGLFLRYSTLSRYLSDFLACSLLLVLGRGEATCSKEEAKHVWCRRRKDTVAWVHGRASFPKHMDSGQRSQGLPSRDSELRGNQVLGEMNRNTCQIEVWLCCHVWLLVCYCFESFSPLGCAQKLWESKIGYGNKTLRTTCLDCNILEPEPAMTENQ